jgi:methionyl-tRNA formyltransferase
MEAGTITPEPQDSRKASYAPILKKEDGLIDWNLPAESIRNRTRGFLPWPGTYSFFRGHLFHIWSARLGPAAETGVAGSLYTDKKRLLVHCGDGNALELLEVQVEGKKRMLAEAFLNGHRLSENEILGSPAQ